MTLRARDVHFRYERGEEVLHGASLTLEGGTALAVVGPNGAGKSTLLSLLAGLERPTAGHVELDGCSPRAWGRRGVARRVAVVPQRPHLPPGFRVRDVVTMGRAPHLGFLAGPRAADHRAVDAALHRTGTWALRDAFVETLSGGEAQRTALARALAQEPRYLLLDEPTHHLDLRYAGEVLRHALDLAHRDGLGVLAVLHDLNLATRCDLVAVLTAGRAVACGPPGAVLQQGLLERVYGTRVEVRPGDPPVIVPG